MSTRFACPHCGKEYPILPSLLGRKVRCKGCGKAFVLGPDGTAKPVDAAQEPSPERLRQFEELSHGWAKRTASAVVERKVAFSTANVIPVTKSITSRQEARTKAVRAGLSAAADRAAAALLAGKGTGDKQGAATSHSPLLLGSGIATSRQRRRLALAAFVFAVITACIWLLCPPTSPDTEIWNRIGGSIDDDDALAELLWLEPGIDDGDPLLLADPGRIALGESRDVAVQAFAADIAPQLHDRLPSQRLAAFVRTDQVDDLRGALLLLPPPLKRDRAIAQLRAQGFDLLLYEDLAEQLEASIPDREASTALARLLVFEACGPDDDRWRQLLVSKAPRQLRLRPARGSGATLLRREGNRLRARNCPAWSGMLLSVNGESWPAATRVLSCRPLDRLDDDGGPLRIAARQAAQRFAGRL